MRSPIQRSQPPDTVSSRSSLPGAGGTARNGEKNGTAASGGPARNSTPARRTAPPLLDPHGIYGTRTAYRLRAARRRRIAQNVGMALLLLLLVAGAVSLLRRRRVVTVAGDWRVALMAPPAAMPALAGGGRDAAILVPTESGSLLAGDAATGAPRGGFATAFPLRAEPLVVGDIAFVPCEDGTLFAVAWRTGRVLWRHGLGGAVMARPAYTRLSRQAATPKVSAPPLAAASGRSGVASSGGPSASAAARSGLRPIVVAGNDDGTVVALEAASGRLLWRQKGGAPVGDALTVTDGAAGPARVLVPFLGGLGSRGGLWCLDARTGRTLWRAELNAAHLPAPAFEMVPSVKPGERARGRVYTTGDDGAIFCLDMANGRKIWKTFVRPLPGSPTGDAVVLRGEPLLQTYAWGTCLIAGGNDGGVRCLDARNGRVLWTFDAGAAVRSRPVPLHLGEPDTKGAEAGERATQGPLRDVILIGSEGPAIYGLDARDGTMVWRFRTDGPAFATPMLHGDHLLTITREGYMYRFPLPAAVNRSAASTRPGARIDQ